MFGSDFGSIGGKALTSRDASVGVTALGNRRQNGELRPFLTQNGGSMARRGMRTVGVDPPGEYAAEPLPTYQTGVPIKDDPYRVYADDDRATPAWGGLLCTVAAILVTCAIAIPVTWAVTKNAFEGSGTKDIMRDLDRICTPAAGRRLGPLPAACQTWMNANYTSHVTSPSSGFDCGASTGHHCQVKPATTTPTPPTAAELTGYCGASATGSATHGTCGKWARDHGYVLAAPPAASPPPVALPPPSHDPPAPAASPPPTTLADHCAADVTGCLAAALPKLSTTCTSTTTGGVAGYPTVCDPAITWATAWAPANGFTADDQCNGATPTLATCAASAATAANGDGVCGTWAKLPPDATPVAGLGLAVPVACTPNAAECTADACTASKASADGADVCGVWAKSAAGGSLIEATSCTAADACVSYTPTPKDGSTPITYPASCVDAAFFTTDKCVAVHGGPNPTGLQMTPAISGSTWSGSATMPTAAEYQTLPAGSAVTGSFWVKMQGSKSGGTTYGLNDFNIPQRSAVAAAVADYLPTITSAGQVEVAVHQTQQSNTGSGSVATMMFHRRALQQDADPTCSVAETPCFYLKITVHFPSTSTNGADFATTTTNAMTQFNSWVHNSYTDGTSSTFKTLLNELFRDETTTSGASMDKYTAIRFTDTWYSYTGAPPASPSPPPPFPPPPSPPPPSPPPPSPPPSPPPPTAAPPLGTGAATGAGAGSFECVNNYDFDGRDGDKTLSTTAADNCDWDTFGFTSSSVDAGCCTDQEGNPADEVYPGGYTSVAIPSTSAQTFADAREFCATKCYDHILTPGGTYPLNTPCAGFTVLADGAAGTLPTTAETATAFYASSSNTYTCRLYTTCQAGKVVDGSVAATATRGRQALTATHLGLLTAPAAITPPTIGLTGALVGHVAAGTRLVAAGRKTVVSTGKLATQSLTVFDENDPTLAIATSDKYMLFPPSETGTLSIIGVGGFTITKTSSGAYTRSATDTYALYTTASGVNAPVARVPSTAIVSTTATTTAVTATLTAEQVAALATATGKTLHYAILSGTKNTGLLNAVTATSTKVFTMATASAPAAVAIGSACHAGDTGALIGYAQSYASPTITLVANSLAATATAKPYFVFPPEVDNIVLTVPSTTTFTITEGTVIPATSGTFDTFVLYTLATPASAPTNVKKVVSTGYSSPTVTISPALSANEKSAYTTGCTGTCKVRYALVSRTAPIAVGAAFTPAAGTIGVATSETTTTVPTGTQIVVDGQDATFTALGPVSSAGVLPLATDFQRTGPTIVGDTYRRFTPVESGTVATTSTTLTLTTALPTVGAAATLAQTTDRLVLWTVATSGGAVAYVGTVALTGTSIATKIVTYTAVAGFLSAFQLATLTAGSGFTFHYAVVSRDTFRSGELSGTAPTTGALVPLNTNRKPAAADVLPGTQVLVNGEVAGTALSYHSGTAVATLAEIVPTPFSTGDTYNLFAPQESGSVNVGQSSTTLLVLAASPVATSVRAVSDKIFLWTVSEAGVKTYVTTTTVTSAADTNQAKIQPLTSDQFASLKATGVASVGYAILTDKLAFSAASTSALTVGATTVTFSAASMGPLPLTTGTRVTADGTLAGHVKSVVDSSGVTTLTLTAESTAKAASGKPFAFYPPMEVAKVTFAPAGGTSFTLEQGTSSVVVSTAVNEFFLYTNSGGTIALIGSVKSTAVSASGVVTIPALTTAQLGLLQAGVTAGTAHYSIGSTNVADGTCPASRAPKSYSTTRCTIDTQPNNCANGRDYCCTPATANHRQGGTGDFTCEYPGALEYGHCGTSDGYTTPAPPPPSPAPIYVCPNPSSGTSAGAISTNPTDNCVATAIPVSTPTSVNYAGCCANAAGEALPGLQHSSTGLSYVMVLAKSLDGAGTVADGAMAKCAAVCDAYEPFGGGWDCNGYDVRLATTTPLQTAYPLSALQQTEGSPYLTTWNSINKGYAVCTLYKECRTSALADYTPPGGTAVTCSVSQLPKAYVGKSCTAATAWFDCPLGRPFCCQPGTEDGSTGVCVVTTGLEKGTCSTNGP